MTSQNNGININASCFFAKETEWEMKLIDQ
jgi:hypothetical protein